jgi:hypothetical protein
MVGQFLSGALRAPDLIELIANKLIKESGNNPDTQWISGGTGWHNADTSLKSRPWAGKFTVTGSGTGTFTDGYGVSPVRTIWLRCRKDIGAADINVFVTYVDTGDVTVEVLSPTIIPAGAREGTTIQIFLNSPDVGAKDVTAVRITGGTAADEFEVVYSISTAATPESRRVVVNADEGVFLCMELVNTPVYTNSYTYDAHYAKGVRFIWSQSWDGGGHTYPPVNMLSFIGYEGVRGDMRYAPQNSFVINADLDTLQTIYWLWVEPNGFALMAYPEGNTSDTYQQAFFTVCERNLQKEYTDGYTGFVQLMTTNIACKGSTGYPTNRMVPILRPFAYQSPVSSSDFEWSAYSFNGNGIHCPYNAYKSQGNGKVYYVKPIINNNISSLMPIFQADLWFYWTEGMGLVDGDIVAIQGSTKKYICKSVSSPDNTTKLTFAMKYSN